MKTSGRANKVLVIGFLSFIVAPIVLTLLGLKNYENLNNEQESNVKLWNLKGNVSNMTWAGKSRAIAAASFNFVKRFDKHYNTHFALRNSLLQAYTTIVRTGLGTNPLPGKVVEGEEGWFFLGEDYSNEVSESKALKNFSTDELKVIMDTLTCRASWLRERGIHYYLCIVPNKTTTYGDKLSILHGPKVRQAEQLNAALKGRVNVVDLTLALKGRGNRLYYQTDSHWNDAGALLAYQHLMDTIRDTFALLPAALSRKDMLIDTATVDQRDLTKQLGIRISETSTEYSIRSPHAITAQEHWPLEGAKVAYEVFERRYTSIANEHKAVVFHDSFGEQLEPYLAEAFGETVFIWDHRFNRIELLREMPDLVVHIIVERNLEVLAER
jgi:alginate O-acetyltransferase complex protein AlgJ